MEISQVKAREVWGQLQSAKNRLRSLRSSAEASIGKTKQLAEGVGASFVSGYLAGKNKGVMPQLFGFDMDMVLGLGGAAAAIMGIAGKYDEDVLNASIGFVGTYAYREGIVVGGKAATQAAGALPAGMYAGAVPAGMYAGAVPAGQYAGAVPANAYR